MSFQINLINSNSHTSKIKEKRQVHHHQVKVQDHLQVLSNQAHNKTSKVINHLNLLLHHLDSLNNKNNNKTMNKKKLQIKNRKDQVEKKNTNQVSHSTKIHKRCNQWKQDPLEECQALVRTRQPTLVLHREEVKLRRHNHHQAVCLANLRQVQV